MKRFFKIVACAMLILAMVSMMSSCKKDYKTQVIYTAGWGNYELSQSEFKIIKDYLAEKGAMSIGQYKIYNVTSTDSEDDCLRQADEMAKADFANSIRNLKVEEIQPKLKVGDYFSYVWHRTDGAGNVVKIGEWECPAIPVPPVYGKITVNGTENNVTGASISFPIFDGSLSAFITLHSEKTRYAIRILGVEQEGVVPEGNFDVDGEMNIGYVVCDEVRYYATGTSCTISKNGMFYKFASSGTATDKNGNKIEFSVDCDQVVL